MMNCDEEILPTNIIGYIVQSMNDMYILYEACPVSVSSAAFIFLAYLHLGSSHESTFCPAVGC